MSNIRILLNDKYKILEFLEENQINVGGEEFIPLAQHEIAKAMNFSLMKTNSIMIRLREYNLIDLYHNTKGRYILTEEAKMILNEIKILDSREVLQNAEK